MQFSYGFKKYFANTGWLSFEVLLRIVISLPISIYVTRYLGPYSYGLLSYAVSFVGLFSAFVTLGLNNIIVRNLVSDKKKRDELLGTVFYLQVVGVIVSLGIIMGAIRFIADDSFTNLLVFIIALATIFQSFNVIDFYFQSRVLSKYVVYVRIFSMFFSAIIKLLLIYFKMGLIFFAVNMIIESVILAVGLIIVYANQKLSIFNWKMEFDFAKILLRDSWPLILSSMAISIYMKIDQVMIKEMIGIKAVGNYAVAVKLAELWYFIPMVINKSVFPAIVNAKKGNEKIYHERIQNLYNLMTWLAIGIALPTTFVGDYIIKFLYGLEYQDAAGVLRIYVWAGVPVFLGVANSQYLIAENYTRIAFFRTFFGMIVNVLFNIILIPRYGIHGAAIATLA